MALAWGGLAAPRATFCKPMNENLLIYASFLFEAVFWLGAYALILYHAFKEKTYGVPVVAMCGNIAWEFIFGLNRFPACPVYWADCSPVLMTTLTLMAALMDAVILFTVLYFGRHQFKGPFWLRYFIPLTLAGVAFSFVLQHSLMGGLYTPNYYGAAVNGSIPEFLQIGLQGGMFTGWALVLLMGILFIRWLGVREGLEGQSFYIAVCMFLGNLGAYFFLLTAAKTIPPSVGWLIGAGLLVNLIYIGMVYQRGRTLGLNPWRHL